MTDVTYSSDSALVGFGSDDGTIGVLNLITKDVEIFKSNPHQPGI